MIIPKSRRKHLFKCTRTLYLVIVLSDVHFEVFFNHFLLAFLRRRKSEINQGEILFYQLLFASFRFNQGHCCGAPFHQGGYMDGAIKDNVVGVDQFAKQLRKGNMHKYSTIIVFEIVKLLHWLD